MDINIEDIEDRDAMMLIFYIVKSAGGRVVIDLSERITGTLNITHTGKMLKFVLEAK
jgi:hypothetical protein